MGDLAVAYKKPGAGSPPLTIAVYCTFCWGVFLLSCVVHFSPKKRKLSLYDHTEVSHGGHCIDNWKKVRALILQYFQPDCLHTFISALVIMFNREIMAEYTRDDADNMEDCGFHSKQRPSCPSAGHHRKELSN